MTENEVKGIIKSHILADYLPGEDPAALLDDTPLVTSSIIDSIAMLNLVAFLEQQFQITLEAHEATADHLNTVNQIARLVLSKSR